MDIYYYFLGKQLDNSFEKLRKTKQEKQNVLGRSLAYYRLRFPLDVMGFFLRSWSIKCRNEFDREEFCVSSSSLTVSGKIMLAAYPYGIGVQ